jgi:hypothetical protein
MRRSVYSAIFLIFFIATVVSGGLFEPRGESFGVTVQAGETFVLGSFANITFAKEQTFQTSVTIPDSHTACFDSTCFSVQKYPASYPAVKLNITLWQPTAGSGTLIRWTPTLASGTIVWFNVSGLGTASYAINLGSLAVSSQIGPNVAFSWSSFPFTGDFAITVAGIPGGVGGVNLACTQNYFFLSVQVFCSATTGIAVQAQLLQWYVNGVSAGTGFTFAATVPVLSLNGTATITLVYAPLGTIVYTKTMPLDARLNLAIYVFVFTVITIFVTTRQRDRLTRWKVKRIRPVTDFIPGSLQTVRIGRAIVTRGRLIGNGELANYTIKERVLRKRS